MTDNPANGDDGLQNISLKSINASGKESSETPHGKVIGVDCRNVAKYPTAAATRPPPPIPLPATEGGFSRDLRARSWDI